MSIENIMYFALGFLAAGLLALMVAPAVWRRAVRLTKKRIEAATPVTLAEFRADKDQLRAEFALSTRRLELNVDTLRKRLAEQLSDIERKKGDLALLKAERDQQLEIVRELELRENDLRARVLDLEKETTDLSQRLRMRDRELAEKTAQLDQMRTNRPLVAHPVDADGLTGDYEGDVEALLASLVFERERTAYLENHTRELLSRLEGAEQHSAEASEAIAEMRLALAHKDDEKDAVGTELLEAEARIADAENRLNALLEETGDRASDIETSASLLLAQKLSLEDELEHLREKIVGVESAIMSDWEKERLEQSHLRERLNDIASDVSRLVYAVDGEAEFHEEESLFDRVQKFAGDSLDEDELPVHPAALNGPSAEPSSAPRGGKLSDRMAALRDMHAR